MKDRENIPVALQKGLAKSIDEMVEKGIFSSKSEALRFGARLVVMLEKRMHERAEDYAYEEFLEGVTRGKRNVLGH